MPLIQKLRNSVPNGRSPEVWRKRVTREPTGPIRARSKSTALLLTA